MSRSRVRTWLTGVHFGLGLRGFREVPALEGWLTYPVSRTEEVATMPDGEPMAVDVYRPEGAGPWPAMLIVEGFDEQGTRAPRIVTLARLIARTGVVVVIPDLVEVFDYRFSTRTPERIEAAFAHMAALPDVRTTHLGLFGISVAGGFGIAAATRASIASRLRFIVGFAPFYDIRNLLDWTLTGRYRHAGATHYGRPHPWTRYIYLYNFLELVVDPANPDFSPLRAALRLRLGPHTEEAAQAARMLSPSGRALLARLDSESATFFEPLLARTEKAYPALARALSPHINVGALQGRLFLIHNRHDDIIPFSESVALAEAARACPGLHCELLVTGAEGHDGPVGRFRGPWHALRHDLPELAQYSAFLHNVFRAIRT